MKPNFLIATALALATLTGCAGQTATPAYVQANAARLKVVEPMLRTYANDHVASLSNVNDLLASWHLETDAQARNAAAATQPAK